jgi:hypothetical protein
MKLAILLLSAACVLSTASAQAQSRYSYSADASEVTDSQTGLVWRRCAEGMAWSGSTCTGTTATYSHEQALAHARTQTGWRLPSVKELGSITDRSRSTPAIDVTAFPGTSFAWFWSSSPYAANAGYAWGVSFNDGYVSYDYRSSNYAVRLVR